MANERVIDIFEGLLKTKELIAEKNFTQSTVSFAFGLID